MPTRPAAFDDLDAIAEIYAHYVLISVTTFELDPPDRDEWRRRFGFVDAGRVTNVGYKHDRFVDTFLPQRTLS